MNGCYFETFIVTGRDVCLFLFLFKYENVSPRYFGELVSFHLCQIVLHIGINLYINCFLYLFRVKFHKRERYLLEESAPIFFEQDI